MYIGENGRNIKQSEMNWLKKLFHKHDWDTEFRTIGDKLIASQLRCKHCHKIIKIRM